MITAMASVHGSKATTRLSPAYTATDPAGRAAPLTATVTP